MKMLRMVAAVLLLTFSARSAGPQFLQQPVSIRMKDGVLLSALVFRPPGDRRFPCLLIRTPYGKGKTLLASYAGFIDNGYALVVQDVRGRYASEGSFDPLNQESDDGTDTLDWIARQPWSDGQIGMLGGSYLGIAQWKAALTKNKHLKAIFPVVSGNDEYRDRFYSRGGAMKLGHRLLWMAENLSVPRLTKPAFRQYVRHRPLRTADRFVTGRTVKFWQDVLDHPEYDRFWTDRSTQAQMERVQVPAFIVGGWYDNFVEGDLEAYSALSKRAPHHRLVVGAWPHSMTVPFAGLPFGSDSAAPVRRFQLDWFRQWLLPRAVQTSSPVPPVQIFVMGANKWRAENEWPLKRARFVPWYLSSKAGDGILMRSKRTAGQDSFTYDPSTPVPTLGGAVCCNPKVFPWGPMDQSPVERRKDVLVYTSAPLRSELEVTGAVRVTLFVSTSAPDTDFTAKLVDVFPDGTARNLCDGILRLRYRKSLTKAVLAQPGVIYPIAVEAGVTSNLFKAGHRIRLEISSSNFPRFDANPNTGSLVADEISSRVAQQTIWHGNTHPSSLILPIVN